MEQLQWQLDIAAGVQRSQLLKKGHFFGDGRKSPGRSPGAQKAPRAARSAAGGGAEQGRAEKCQNQECPFAPYFKMALKLVIFRVPED